MPPGRCKKFRVRHQNLFYFKGNLSFIKVNPTVGRKG